MMFTRDDLHILPISETCHEPFVLLTSPLFKDIESEKHFVELVFEAENNIYDDDNMFATGRYLYLFEEDVLFIGTSLDPLTNTDMVNIANNMRDIVSNIVNELPCESYSLEQAFLLDSYHKDKYYV